MDIETERLSLFFITWWMLEKSRFYQDSCYLVIRTCKEKIRITSELIKKNFLESEIVKKTKFKPKYLQDLEIKHKTPKSKIDFYLAKNKKAKIESTFKNLAKMEEIVINMPKETSDKAFKSLIEVDKLNVDIHIGLLNVFLDEKVLEKAHQDEYIRNVYISSLSAFSAVKKSKKIENFKALQAIYMLKGKHLRGKNQSIKNHSSRAIGLNVVQKNSATTQLGDMDSFAKFMLSFFKYQKSLRILGVAAKDLKKVREILNSFTLEQKESIRRLLDRLMVRNKHLVEKSMIILVLIFIKKEYKIELFDLYRIFSHFKGYSILYLIIERWYDQILKIAPELLMALRLNTKNLNFSGTSNLVEYDLPRIRFSKKLSQRIAKRITKAKSFTQTQISTQSIKVARA